MAVTTEELGFYKSWFYFKVKGFPGGTKIKLNI